MKHIKETDGKNQQEVQKVTVICPFGVSGGSHVTTIVEELSGRTWMLRGALSIAVKRT